MWRARRNQEKSHPEKVAALFTDPSPSPRTRTRTRTHASAHARPRVLRRRKVRVRWLARPGSLAGPGRLASGVTLQGVGGARVDVRVVWRVGRSLDPRSLGVEVGVHAAVGARHGTARVIAVSAVIVLSLAARSFPHATQPASSERRREGEKKRG